MHFHVKGVSSKLPQIYISRFSIQQEESSNQKNQDLDQNDSQIILKGIQSQTKNIIEQNSLWSQVDFQLLVDLYKKYGSKWKQISLLHTKKQQFNQYRTANAIKNLFYSRLRKAIRLLNKLVKTYYKSKYKSFNLNIIFKLTNLIDLKIDKKDYVSEEVIQYYAEFIFRFIRFSKLIINQPELIEKEFEQIESIILSFTALENLWHFLGILKKLKIKKRVKKINKNIRLKLNMQTQKYLYLTYQQCFIREKAQGDVFLQIQAQKQKFLKLNNTQKQQMIVESSNDVRQRQNIEIKSQPFLLMEKIQNQWPQFVKYGDYSFQLKKQDCSQNIQIHEVSEDCYKYSSKDLFDQNVQN